MVGADVRVARWRRRKKMRFLLTSAFAVTLAYLELERPSSNDPPAARLVGGRARYGSRPGFKRRPMFPRKTGRSKWEHGWRHSHWWTRLTTVAESGDEHLLMRETVERKLRLPWELFDALANDMESDPALCERATRAAPLRLKLCAALRHLATGHSFDGLESSFGMSAQTMRDFFWYKFVPWMMKNKYEEHVFAPKSVDELHDICQEYEYAGFPGCCGSVDGVHIPWYGFKAGARAEYVGKEKYPTLVFGVTVDHRYRIMHVTSAHAGATNDKFVIRADDFHTRTMHTSMYTDFTFNLLDTRDGGQKRYRGCYVLCDGGYGDWRNLVSAYKCVAPGSYKANWSHRVGSVRKDAECTFGILKARFRILFGRQYRHNATDVEYVFKVCCILHNMIMRARDVTLWRGSDMLQQAEEEHTLDDAVDLHEVNARGEFVRNIQREDAVLVAGDDDNNDTRVLDERDDGGIHELHAKVAMQDALTRHWRFYIEQHKDEYDGYYPFVYRASLDAQRRQDAEQGGR